MSQPTYPPAGSGAPGASSWPAPPPGPPPASTPYGGQPPPEGPPPPPRQPATGRPAPHGAVGRLAGPPDPPQRRKSGPGPIALVVAAVLVLAVIGVALWLGLRSGGGQPPAATQQPTGLGADPALDDDAQRCYDGDMPACDDLYRRSPVDSAYETYGGTCAGRQSDALVDRVWCVDAFD